MLSERLDLSFTVKPGKGEYWYTLEILKTLYVKLKATGTIKMLARKKKILKTRLHAL